MTKKLSASPVKRQARPLRTLIYENRKKCVRGAVLLETVCCMKPGMERSHSSANIDWLTDLYVLDGYLSMRRFFANLIASNLYEYITPNSRLYHKVLDKVFATLTRWSSRPRPHFVHLHYPYADYRHFWDKGDYPEYMRNIFLAIDVPPPTPGGGVIKDPK